MECDSDHDAGDDDVDSDGDSDDDDNDEIDLYEYDDKENNRMMNLSIVNVMIFKRGLLHRSSVQAQGAYLECAYTCRYTRRECYRTYAGVSHKWGVLI